MSTVQSVLRNVSYVTFSLQLSAANKGFMYSSISDIGVLEGVTRIPNRGERKREDLQPLMQDTNYNSD